MAYVNYGPWTQHVQQQCILMLTTHPTFTIQAERFQFPGQQPGNYLVFKGYAQDRFGGAHNLKYILPSNYPQAAPQCYFDKQLSLEIVQRLDYLGHQNMLTIPYLQTWNPNMSNLTQLTNALLPVIANNPPVAGGQNRQAAYAQPAQPNQPSYQQQAYQYANQQQ